MAVVGRDRAPRSTLDGIAVSLAIVGGRVIDPESGLDTIADVEIAGDRIIGVSCRSGDGSAASTATTARHVIDATGLVVCPGFIDLHSHAQSLAGARLQAFDGVTTALDLECGALPVRAWYENAGEQGRPIHYGYSASWSASRALALTGWCADPRQDRTGFGAFQAMSAVGAWNGPLNARGQDRMIDALCADVDQGALGIGALLGYAPQTDPAEFAAVVATAADLQVGTFVHSRSSAQSGAVTARDAVQELVDLAGQSGAHVHLCHVNSTSSLWLDQIIELLDTARSDGVSITTEAYPYGRGSTVVGAAFLSPEDLRREGRAPSSLIYPATGETIRDAARLEALRATDPGGIVLTLSFDEDDRAEAELLQRSWLIPHSAFASDAMPTVEPVHPDDRWPLPSSAFAHPRSAGCFTRVLRQLVREAHLLTLPEAVRRCTVVPADILAPTAPAMRQKGRLQVGADADVVVLDPENVEDRATYTSLAPAVGVRHLVVSGQLVIAEGELQLDVNPGRPITSRHHIAPEPAPYPALATHGGDT